MNARALAVQIIVSASSQRLALIACEEMDSEEKETVVITGGCGFLAHYLIQLLQTKYKHRIKELRIFDYKKFVQFLKFPMNEAEGGIRTVNKTGLCESEGLTTYHLTGATTVFHLAAEYHDFSLSPIAKDYYKHNYIGTNILIDVMKKQNVPKLVFVGDEIGRLGRGDHIDASERGSKILPETFVLGEYGRSKTLAEQMVHDATGAMLANGERLRTITIRPGFLFGEGDSGLLAFSLRFFSRIRCFPVLGKERQGGIQLTYAGNAAAMAVKAWEKLEEDPERFSGEAFICSDPVELTSYYDYVRRFLRLRKQPLREFRVNYYVGLLVYCLFLPLLWLVAYFRPFSELLQDIPSLTTVRMFSAWNYGFYSVKARLFLDFVPPYDQKEAMERTLEWWEKRLNPSHDHKSQDRRWG